MNPALCMLLVNYIAKIVITYGKHILLMPDSAIIYLLLFGHDIVLISDTISVLQNQLDNLRKGADTLGLDVNYVKMKVMVIRNGGFLAEHEKWLLGAVALGIVNECRYLGSTFTTKLSFNTLQSDLVRRARTGMLQVTR